MNKECCETCKYNLKLVKWDYSHGGCEHGEYEGHACLALVCEGIEGVVIHMVGNDPKTGICEMYERRFKA